jgi:ComEC/Rec2-related protein
MFSFRYPAIVLLICTVAGTVLGRKYDPGVPVLATLVIAALIYLILSLHSLPKHLYIIPLALLTFVGAGLHSVLLYRSDHPNDIEQFISGNEKYRFFASIEKWPVLKRHKTILTCQIDSIAHADVIISVSGSILVTLRQETTQFSLGDQISFSGVLKRPLSGEYPGQFDYAHYLRDKAIRGTVSKDNPAQILVLKKQWNKLGRAINSTRQWILGSLRDNLTEESAAMASGFLIGETRNIPDDIYLAFRRTGTMHLLAVSGSNVALILVVVYLLLRVFPIKRIPRLVLLLIIIVGFSHLSYNQPSVVRASVMASLIIASRILYRRADLNNILATAATFLILYDPGNLFDIGFQLSFAVTWGLILFLPHINKIFESYNFPPWMKYILLIACSSLIASLISAPITAYYFGEISLVTVFSNLLIVPLVSVAVIGIVILMLVNLAMPALAILPGALLDRLLTLINSVVKWFGGLEFASAGLPSFHPIFAFLILAGVSVLMLGISYRTMRRLSVFMVLIVICFLLIRDILSDPGSGKAIEIYNHGSSQSLIINESAGFVVYSRQEQGGYDDFNNELLPYLLARRQPLPIYYLFMEPHYRTEQLLNLTSEDRPRIRFRPYEYNEDFDLPSLWYTSVDDNLREVDSGYVVYLARQAMVLQLSPARRILLTRNVEALEAIPQSEIDGLNYYIVIIGMESDLLRILDRPDISKAIILLESSESLFNTLSNNELNILSRGIPHRLINNGENYTLLF